MGYRTKTPLPAVFGNGTDGDLHITADALMTKPEYSLESLRIDAGVTWSVPVFSPGVFFPIVTLRCRKPIIVNGTLSALGIAWGWNTSDFMGYEGGAILKELMGDMVPNNIYPVCGGHCRAAESDTPRPWGSHIPYPHSNDGGYGNGSTILDSVGQDIAQLLGPRRWFRCAVGAGGAIYHGNRAENNHASRGGGALLIYAPQVQLGTNGRITADGGDGIYSTVDDGGGNGGGGGGYVELNTITPIAGTYTWDKDNPLATGDKARITATGGGSTNAVGTVVRDASNRAGYNGMAGVVQYFLIGGV